MPGMDLDGPAKVNESTVLGSLKAHRAMPRKELTKNDPPTVPQAGRGRSPPVPLKMPVRRSYPTSDRLRSWMRESSEIHALPIIGQPLTPPINFRDNFKSWIDDKALRDREFLSQQKISPGNTPLVANSPPTPETTPPRQMYKFAAADSLPSSRNVSNGSVGTVRHVPESRTDSFRTARENLSSDDESHPPDSPSLHPSRQKWLRDLGLSKQKDVGLGLGLETDEDEPPTPKGVVPTEKGAKKGEDFVTFNGVWGSNEPHEAKETENQIARQRDLDEADQQKIKEVMKGAYLDSPTLGIEARSLSKNQPGTKRRLKERRNSETAEQKQEIGERMQSPWPLKDDMHATVDLDTESQHVDAKRLSQASTTSTVVEAMVIESPPQRRQTLRHTGKMMRLDTLSQQQTRSNRSSLQSDDHSLKYQLRNAKNPDQGLRKRFASETSQAGSQKSALAKLEGSSVVVVPDRRSSLQSSVESSKRISRTFSLNSKPQSSRPTTAPEDSAGYFDVPRRQRRTVSVVIQQATPSKKEKKAEKDVSPPTNIDASTAASAASRGLSRTTSATSGGLATHYIPQTPTSQGSITPQTTDAQDNQIINVNRSTSGDWSALRPRSALVTPLSLRSAQSSTPGMLEVNEATAISIYPHTNKSILVIQEMAGRDDSSPREQSTVIAGNASIALPSTFAPLTTQPAPPSPQRELTNSPLQNPREPPQPPDFKIIPPTPANAASSSEDTVRNVRSHKKSSRFSAPFTTLKRAMSARPYSESISNPFIFTRTLSLRATTDRHRPHSTEDNKDSQLHPFWRPRSFWDGDNGSDSESEFGNNGTLSPQRPSSHGTAFKTSKAPKRSQSLTSRITSSLRPPSTRRPVPRRASISLTSDIIPKHTIDDFANIKTKPATTPRRTLSLTTPKRTLSLTRKVGGSLGLPSKGATLRHRSRRSTTAYWHNQPNYEFIPADDRPYMASTTSAESRSDQQQQQQQEEEYGGHSHVPSLGTSSFRSLAERIERRRSVREEGRREERRNWLKGRIGFVGVKDVDVPSGFDIVHPPPPHPPTAAALHPQRPTPRHGVVPLSMADD